jgi:hypothetical protein
MSSSKHQGLYLHLQPAADDIWILAMHVHAADKDFPARAGWQAWAAIAAGRASSWTM